MLILDTNHYSEYLRKTAAGARLHERISLSEEMLVLTIITAQEAIQGWLAATKSQHADYSVKAYSDFHECLDDLGGWFILPWNEAAAGKFAELRGRKLRVGTMDLRIASIALEYGATLLTRNLVDFQKVPDLKVENWLD